MPTPGENIKVGLLNPDPNRHEGFSFIDQTSGVGHSIEDLRTDPQNPSWQMGTLNTLYEGDVVVPPIDVAWRRSPVQEAKPFVAVAREQHNMRASAVVSRIAVGSLVVQLRR